MAVSADRVSVANSAVALNTQDHQWQTLTIRNIGATDAADLGSSAVTAGGGFRLAVGDVVTVTVPAGQVLHAISTLTGTTLAVLRI